MKKIEVYIDSQMDLISVFERLLINARSSNVFATKFGDDTVVFNGIEKRNEQKFYVYDLKDYN